MGLTAGSRRTAVVALVSLIVVLILAIGACGGSTSTPTPSPSAAATAPSANPSPPPPSSPPAASLLPDASSAISSGQVCADLADFQAALADLTAMDLESARIRDAIDVIGEVVASGLALVESARAAFGPEAQALGDALAGLQTALQGITGEGSLGDKAATIENAVDEVAAAFDALKAEVAPGCPAPQASGS